MPQLSPGDVWSRWESGARRDGRLEKSGGSDGVTGGGPEERSGGGWRWRWRSAHWGHWPDRGCVVPMLTLWLFLPDESPLHLSLTQAGVHLLLTGFLCSALALFTSALFYIHHNKRNQKTRDATASSQQDADWLGALADGLVVSILSEPLPDSGEQHVRALLSRLEAVSRSLQRGVREEEKSQTSALEDRFSGVCCYLKDRVSSLRALLQVQRECEASVCVIQSVLQQYWTRLEQLHTRVTLSPDTAPHTHKLRAVLTDTQGLFSELSQFKSKVQQCRQQLETTVHLLQTLRSSQQNLAKTVDAFVESTWSKELLQFNTDLFFEIDEDFTSLEQQTSNFVIHLEGLDAAEEAEEPVSLSAVPPYSAASETSHSDSDPESDLESSQLSSEKSHKRSAFQVLCGMKKRRSSR